jgi:hypothetical protein
MGRQGGHRGGYLFLEPKVDDESLESWYRHSMNGLDVRGRWVRDLEDSTVESTPLFPKRV